MKNLSYILVSLMLVMSSIVTSQTTTLYSNDFESTTTGYVTSTNPSDPLWIYTWASHSGCASTDGWRVDNTGGYGTNSNITGNYASIDYGASSCVQDISLCTQEFTPTQDAITIKFDWAHRIYLGSSLIARLYDEYGAVAETLVVATSTDAGTYEQQIAVTAGVAYSIDFRYSADWEYGSKIDNILVTELNGNYESVTIGNGTASSSLVPAYGYYDYSWSSMIFTQSEINETGDIESIAWFVDASSPASYSMDNQKIYLGHTTDSQFSNSPSEDITTDIAVTDYTLVYDGTIDWLSPGWHTIQLQTTFSYNNINNLVVKVENRDGSYTTTYPSFDYTNAANKACYDYQDGSYPTSAGTRTNNRPNIKFLINTVGGALPIELLSFDGSIVEDIKPYAVLEWKVASQINNDYYSILHSTDGYEWSKVCTVPGHGNTNIELSYSAIHENPSYGYNYYKLCQTDYDGTNEEFFPISLLLKAPRKEIVKVFNQMGQEVSLDSKGLLFQLWDNGDITKTIQE